MSAKLKMLVTAAVMFSLAFLVCAAHAAAPAKAPALYAAQEKEIKALVASAVKLIKAKGEAAMAEINANKDSRWGKTPTGVFVSDEKGMELANAVQPELAGKNLWEFRDGDGRLIVQEQWKLVKDKGKGWMECKWAKPGTKEPARCRVYLERAKHKGKPYLVGAAYYPR